MKKQKKLDEFQGWLQFLTRIEDLDWSKPLEEGKWNLHEVVSHMYGWDEYFLEAAILPISADRPLTLQHLDFDAFNAEAVAKGRAMTKEELIQRSRQVRLSIIEEIGSHDADKFDREYTDAEGKPFAVSVYLKDFLWHDRHHMKQIEQRAL